MAPRRRCPTCGSRQWHKGPSSGLIACSEGHVLQNYRNETTELEEMGPHALKKRRLKSDRKKKEVGNADPKLYHGARARYHYFLCLQLLLRKQIVALKRLWELPSEFEVICRDIWALHLEELPNPVPPEPFNHTQQTQMKGSKDNNDDNNDGKGKASNSKKGYGDIPTALMPGSAAGPPTPPADRPRGPEGRESSPQPTSGQSGEDLLDSDSSSDLDDHEIEHLMKENSDLSSSEDDGEADDRQDPASATKTKKGGGRSQQDQHLYETPVSTIAVLIVACWTLRIPALYRDFSRLIESYELPYLDPVRLFPPTMVQHLTKHSKQALSPHHTPSTLLMHKLASRLARNLYSSYAIFIPESNAAPILWRLTRAMGGTPTLYTLTKRVSSILSLPLTLHSSMAPSLRKARKSDPAGHQFDNVPPEVSLMASCIIVLKMVYGLDGKERIPRDAADPACTLPRYDAFIGLLREMDSEDAKKQETVFSTQRTMQLGELSGGMLDDYLSFCEKALLGGEEKHENNDVLKSYFPLGHGFGHAVADVQRMEQEGGERTPLPAIPLQDEGAGKGILQPGQDYAIWNARDVLGTLPADYVVVLGRGARWVGVMEDYLGGVIEKYENRLLRWYEGSKRRSRSGRRGEGWAEEGYMELGEISDPG